MMANKNLPLAEINVQWAELMKLLAEEGHRAEKMRKYLEEYEQPFWSFAAPELVEPQEFVSRVVFLADPAQVTRLPLELIRGQLRDPALGSESRPSPPSSGSGAAHPPGLRQERDDLLLQNERLKFLVMQERRAAAREAQKHDQLLTEHKALRETVDRLVELLRERSDANDALQGVLIGDREGRLRMFERHEGVVMHVADDSVVLTYSIEDEYVDQTYRKEQFIGGRLPKKGDRLAIYVHVAELPKKRDREEPSGAAPDEQRRHRKRAVRPPREF